MKKDGHLFLKDMESLCATDFKIDAHSLLLDLKFLCKEYYVATFTDTGKNLLLTFTNGQKFTISVNEL